MGDGRRYTFKSPATLAAVTKGLLFSLISCELVMAGLLAARYVIFARIQDGIESVPEFLLSFASLDELISLPLSQITIVLIAGSVVSFLIWVYRTSANIRALGAGDLYVTPGVAVGAYFIPVFSLFAPAINMSEVWKASIDAPHWHRQKGTAWVSVWWALALLTGVGGILVSLANPNAADFGSLATISLVLAIHSGGSILLGLTQIVLVTRISHAQLQQHINTHERS